jgi:hypothetical protein
MLILEIAWALAGPPLRELQNGQGRAPVKGQI